MEERSISSDYEHLIPQKKKTFEMGRQQMKSKLWKVQPVKMSLWVDLRKPMKWVVAQLGLKRWIGSLKVVQILSQHRVFQS